MNMLRWESVCGDGTGTLLKVDRNTWKFLKCGAGVGWSRSVGPFVEKNK
jgi:hypothetical protein